MSESSAARQVVIKGPWAAASREPERATTDADLFALLREDLPRGAAKVHDRFAGEVNRLVWHLLGADVDHHDLVQQVFCKVLMHAPKLRDPERFGAWVQAVTVNTVYEELRKREVRRLFQRDRPPSFHPDLSHDVEVRDLLARAKSVLEQLSPKDRIVFVLHFVEGRTLSEVAELCGYSLATGKRRLASAKRRFRLLIAKQPELLKLLGEQEEA